MIKKLRKKFLLSSITAISILLISILLTVNIVNFSPIARDADSLIDRISTEGEDFIQENEQLVPPEQREQMGPSSPDAARSLRYFIAKIDGENNVTITEYRISFISNEEAIELATKLSNYGSGWTNRTLRFKTITKDNTKTVIVVDQSRELLPSYRVLIASIVGTVLGIGVSLLFLFPLSKQFVSPILESDKKQKKFIKDATRELKNPVTIISLDNEMIKNAYGEDENILSIEKEV